ncbi:hypothetical protein A2U01_0116761 [Trifolium medium]|uniref:Uncharacterized protein n=1 Tax=Trifolium medium TaxID=97028 RepID=A0A392W6R4_9FABA|nr:hypothetical protein [Trifolium medium]
MVLEKSPKAWNWSLGRAVEAKMLLEISPGVRFWRLGRDFVVVPVLRDRDFA